MTSLAASPDLAEATPLDQMRALMRAYARNAGVQRIAVLGNAPMEPSDARADDIDAADLVIRVNSFVLDEPGQPRAQGKDVNVVVCVRTTRPTPWFFDRYRERLYLISDSIVLHTEPRPWPESWPEDLGFMSLPNEEIIVPLCESMDWPWREKALLLTTGTIAVATALAAFPDADVAVAGYSFIDNPRQTEWEHQWGDACPVIPRHWLDIESQLFHRWLDEGRIRRLS